MTSQHDRDTEQVQLHQGNANTFILGGTGAAQLDQNLGGNAKATL